ncbi:uncharacterized protein (TIGR02611 family) [Knoellia remsis]|uniref:Uncharacterized protein (TIGR02611 family) n=1 Tax=Knoellia remsis TaxID=407159 RepID=A0A2T0UA54_9MICO|nr:TIGR02611 family protein [Knoellia remsis]PRY54707.1 uncharacterized protein (TIGR02611 family) [Knoellia remsis]
MKRAGTEQAEDVMDGGGDGVKKQPHDYSDPDRVIDAEEDDWAWRRRIKSTPHGARVYRVAVFVVGLVIVLVGLALVPFPGPGWLIVIGGLAVWASEFERAQAVLDFVKKHVRRWEQWVRRQNVFVKLLVGVLTAAFVAAVLWATFKVSGVPTWFPEGVQNWMHTTARL